MTKSTELSHTEDGWKSSLPVEMVEKQMARICMTYLCYHAQREGLPESDAQEERSVSRATHRPGSVQFNSLFQYCAENWTLHLQDDMIKDEDKLIRQALWLYRADRHSSSPWSSHIRRTVELHVDSSGTQIQHRIAMFGYATVLDEVCRLELINLGKPDSTGRTALHWGAKRGHEKIVQILLDKGAEVNAQGGRLCTALNAASRGGDEKVVQILLDREADNNAHEGSHGTALQVASRWGHEKVVQILLDHGAEVNAQGGRFGITLQAAFPKDHKKVIEILLHYGAKGEYRRSVEMVSRDMLYSQQS